LILSFLITGSIKLAGTIASTEVITKIVIFYFHERLWAMVPWGRSDRPPQSAVSNSLAPQNAATREA